MKRMFFLSASLAALIFIFLPQKVSAIGLCTSKSSDITCCQKSFICSFDTGNDQMCIGATVPAALSCPY